MRGRASSAWGRFAPVAACAALCFSLANCTNSSRIDPRYRIEPSARLVEPGATVPKGGGVYRVGSPYIVAGRVYVPQDNPHYRADGVAS
jgi:rare lipoprotein A